MAALGLPWRRFITVTQHEKSAYNSQVAGAF